MKKFILIIILGVLGIVIWSMPVLAATTISISPANINVESGQDFTLITLINPQGIKNYTIRLELNYPPDLLEIKSFGFGSNWMPLSQSGYDLIDNTNGVLIKTAGYPGGLSSGTTFGTISFSAKKTGSGTITVRDDSFALDSTNQDILGSTLAQVPVTITAPTPTETPSVEESEVLASEESTAPVSPEGEEVETIQEEEEVIAAQSEQQSEEKISFLAAVGSIVTFETGKAWISFFMGMVMSAILIHAIYYFIRRSRRKNQNKRNQI